MNWHILWITMLAVVPGRCQNCLTPTNTLQDETKCLKDIHGYLRSDGAFWFGSSWTMKCSRGSSSRSICQNNIKPSGTNMVQRLLDGHYDLLADQLIYLNVTYTSPPGQYTGCDNTVVTTTRTFTLDPLQRTASYKPWHVRAFPQVTWQAEASEMFTLLVVDVGYLTIHGVYINIEGNDINTEEEVRRYTGPLNAFRIAKNPFAFLLFRQSGRVTIKAEYMDVLWLAEGNKLNISKFRDDHGLAGPIGWNWLLSSYDLYSAELSRKRGIESCSSFLAAELKRHNRPFIPSDPFLSIFIHMDFEMPDVNFQICCNSYHYPAATFTLDPIGNGWVTVAGTREQNTRTVTLFPLGSDKKAALAGKHYTMLAVDPDVPFARAGSNERPLVHWLRMNMENGSFETGDNVVPYRGPGPPDDKPHFYYFLLYQQMEKYDINVYQKYAGANCTGTLKFICQFDINKFVGDQQMHLVGATWMQARNDPYVDYKSKQRGRDEKEICTGKAGYSDPCPTSAASMSAWSGAMFVITAMICSVVPNQ